LSPADYNAKVGLCVCCPVTSQAKGYPFEVNVERTPGIEGVVLADQVSTLDWQDRGASHLSRVPNSILERVVEKINDLIG